MKRIRLIHWNLVEGAERADQLRDAGYCVDYHVISGRRDLRRIEDSSPDVIVIDLSRLPSEGSAVAAELRQRCRLRMVPMVFAGGKSGELQSARREISGATGVTWHRVLAILERMTDKPRDNKSVKPSVSAGYSGTPLPKKLGITDGTVVALLGAPTGFLETLGATPSGAKIATRTTAATNLVIWFVRSRKELTKFDVLATSLMQGSVWVAWPKKASGVATDLTEDIIRATGLSLGLVDYKVCAIDLTWSGLLFTRRKSSR